MILGIFPELREFGRSGNAQNTPLPRRDSFVTGSPLSEICWLTMPRVRV